MITIKFLCCLNADLQPTKKFKVKAQAEAGSWEAVQQIIAKFYEGMAREYWKTEFELSAPVGATYSTPANTYPMTVHKISKNGRIVWASYDTYTRNDKAETGFDYTNDHLDKPELWTEFHLKVFHQAPGGEKFVRKGEPATGWSLLIGTRRFWWSEEV
jgi:hypothetical protein